MSIYVYIYIYIPTCVEKTHLIKYMYICTQVDGQCTLGSVELCKGLLGANGQFDGLRSCLCEPGYMRYKCLCKCKCMCMYICMCIDTYALANWLWGGYNE